MKPELQEALYAKYPVLFRKVQDKGQKSPYWPIECGIACNDGWYNLIDEICTKLDKLSKLEDNKSELIIFQIKEKFGTTCFYVEGATEIQRDVISANTMRSGGICEKCGGYGRLRREGWYWIRTLCTKHAKEMGYKLESFETE
ncbi:MAG: hypothetical protein QXL01_04380 [Thermoplasmatales archaeon]